MLFSVARETYQTQKAQAKSNNSLIVCPRMSGRQKQTHYHDSEGNIAVAHSVDAEGEKTKDD
jgi:hypothetical protein